MAVVAVRDNDDAPQMTVEDARAAEDAGVLVFSIRLNAPSDLPITVDYATSDGTATGLYGGRWEPVIHAG